MPADPLHSEQLQTKLSDETRHLLIGTAQQVRQRAYAPYSHYMVGAALLGANGEIYTGCNVENAAYPATICAERAALVKAVSEGVQKFVAIAVVTERAGSPCGMCRQMLFEFAPDMTVIVADGDGHIKYERTLSALLPDGFGPQMLTHAE